MIRNENVKKIQVKEGMQNLEECLESIGKTGLYISNSDMTSTFIVKMRILSMRTLLDLLESYNNQLNLIEEVE